MHPYPISRRKFLATSAALAAHAASGSYATAASANLTSLTEGNTKFGLDLYSVLRKKKGNVFFSPFSMSVALGMTATGAKGTTLAEFQKVLHLPADLKTAYASFGELLSEVNGTGPAEKRAYQLNTVNALWAQVGYPWRPEFLKVCQNDFRAGLENVDYRFPEAARRIINTWVEQQTKDKIKELLPKDSITQLTRLVLTNAIYFKSGWQHKFYPQATKKQPFTLADGTKVDVPLMSAGLPVKYLAKDGVQLVELPYIGDELSMVVLLPDAADGLAKLEEKLTEPNLKTWIAAASVANRFPGQHYVHVLLPKFKVETTYEMTEAMKELGLKAAFDDADFTGMSTSTEQLRISAILHKAFVDVDEEGTEAAAATAVVMSAGGPPGSPKEFRADRPFLFLIRHNKTGSILFLGRVANPTT